MKNLALVLIIGSVLLPVNLFSQIKVSSTGMVGINNTSPTYQLDINGTLRITNSGLSLMSSAGSFFPSSGTSSLGTPSNYWSSLFVTNPYFYYSPVITSDKNLKTDIRDLDNSSDKLLGLRPVKYKMKPKLSGDPKSDSIQIAKAKVDQCGFLAQELQGLFPDLVATDEDGVLGIRYIDLIPLLVKGFQEQQVQIDSLKARITKLEKGK